VDHFSIFVYVTFQETKADAETMKSKWEFEDFARQHSIIIQKIWANNSVYTSADFKEACAKKNQIYF
jgi:hypothetical protein